MKIKNVILILYGKSYKEIYEMKKYILLLKKDKQNNLLLTYFLRGQTLMLILTTKTCYMKTKLFYGIIVRSK